MNGYAAYKNKQQQSTSSALSVAKLLEKALEHMEKALKAHKEDNIEARFNCTQDAAEVILGLRGCLNHKDEEAKEMAKTLQTFYDLLDEYICFFNIKQDAKYAKAVMNALKTMADTWRQVDEAIKTHDSMPNVEKAVHASMQEAQKNSVYDVAATHATDVPQQSSRAAYHSSMA